MGIKMFSDSELTGFSRKRDSQSVSKPRLGEPIARNFKILRSVMIGKYVISEMQYPDAVTYNGKKILVYDDYKRYSCLISSGIVDPHFLDKSYSPTARFVPTEEGWDLALKFARMMED